MGGGISWHMTDVKSKKRTRTHRMIKSFQSFAVRRRMYAPILTFRSPTLSVPYFSLDDIMGSRKRTLDQMLSGGEGDAPVRNPGAWRPPPHCLSRLSHRAETNVFAFEMKFVRESSSIENPRINLAWARSDRAGVKDRLLGHGPSLDVLTEFFADALEFQGTIVAHNLCWKSAMLETQFSRFEMNHLAACWRKFAQRGFCLQSPEVGSWLGVGDQSDYRTSMADLCRGVGLNYDSEARAGDVALLCVAIWKELRQLARPPCARGEAPHELAPQHCCMRDNGEAFSATCRLCGHCT